MTLSDAARRDLLHIAWAGIDAAVRGSPPPVITPHASSMQAPAGVFVTLHLHGELRGCIGFVQPIDDLFRVTAEAAASAATGDPRFPPIQLHDLHELHFEISILSPMVPLTHTLGLRIGDHGLFVRRGHHRGLLLPQVAVEHQWDVRTFLEQTCVKAGLPRRAWQDPGTELRVFTATILDNMSTPSSATPAE